MRPAWIEHNMITRGLDRNAIMGSLGEDLPYPAWHYELAAAELGFPPDVDTSPQSGKSKGGVGVRGRCDDRTPALMRLYRRAIGTNPLLICTWDHTDPAILTELRNICDEVILIPDLEDPGFRNRARQINLAQALLNACAQSCEMTLMTRTDIALFRPNILTALTALWHQYPTRDDRVHGHIVIPNVYTRRYMSDHPSDMIMFGDTTDLQRYWSPSPFSNDEQATFIEQYLPQNFRKYLNIHPNVRDLPSPNYMQYLRDHFIVRDFSCFEGWWLKRGHELRSAGEGVDYSGLVTQAIWERLHHTDQDKPPENPWAPGMRGALLEGVFPRGYD